MPKSNSKKARKIIVFSVIALVLAGLTALVIFKKREVAITVETEKAARRSLTELVVANGRIQPVVQVKISPEVSGEIIDLPVKEGQLVKKGELLLRIKPDAYIANSNSAQASFMSAVASRSLAEANLRKAEQELKRNQDLFKSKLISDSLFLEIRTAYQVAKASHETADHQVNVAKASLARAKEELDKTTINSPLTGTVSKLNSQLGERVVGTAMMTGTEVMTVADLNEMEARVDIGEIDVVLIAPGQTARLEVDAFRDRKFGGVVTEIANSSKGSGQPGMGGGGGQSQEATRFEVKIRINEKEIFRPGMSVTSEIETRYRTNALTVPIQCVTTRVPKDNKKDGAKTAKKPETTRAAGSAKTNAAAAKKTNAPPSLGTNAAKSAEIKKPGEAPKPVEVVFVVDGERVKMAPVKRGISDENYVEITEGLKEGAEVVSGGYKAINRELEEGKRIKKGQPAAEPGKATKQT